MLFLAMKHKWNLFSLVCVGNSVEILHRVWVQKNFRKTRCIVDRGMFSRDSACLILRRGLFSNNDRTFSISPSLIRGLPLPPPYAMFPAVKNCSCQRRMLFRVGGILLIDAVTHLLFVVIELVSMYFATICAFSESVNAIL